MRVMDIYHFLRFNLAGQKIIEIMPSSEQALILDYVYPRLQNVRDSEEMDQRFRRLYNHWQALIVALAMGYYFRLPSTSNDQYHRFGFAANMSRYMNFLSPLLPVLPFFFVIYYFEIGHPLIFV